MEKVTSPIFFGNIPTIKADISNARKNVVVPDMSTDKESLTKHNESLTRNNDSLNISSNIISQNESSL
jgi:hypothetical protein